MRFPRTIKSLWVASPICLAVVISGCKSEDKSTAWEEALDPSDDDKDDEEEENEDDDEEEDAGKDDETSISTDETQTSSASTSTATTSTQSNSGSEPGSGESSSADESDQESSDDVEDSTSETETSEPTEADAGGGTSDDETTSSPGGCDGYLLCETFEDVTVGEIPEGWNRRGEEVAVSEDDAYRGERALKVDASSPGPRQIVHDATVLGGAHWGRVFFRVDVPVPEAFVHTTVVAFSGDATESGPSEFRVVNMNKQNANTANVGSKLNWAYNVQVTGGEEWVCESNYDWQFDGEWHCAEYFVDAGSQTYEFYYDSERITLGSGDCSRWELPAVFGELRVGWNYYADAPPGFTAYVDDIAFDDERIGCD